MRNLFYLVDMRSNLVMESYKLCLRKFHIKMHRRTHMQIDSDNMMI